ncbi:hypothetical protein XBJ1_4047 [Xenorhabdus bovienii SS-2004]|uniref:Uncharacterized protein n=1 Tax=Xenorhabdus bovienii (strain SS-2004) TaxID=406818 RepID=D3V680_XENBS|nr:hypothetical protein XBJ1_4047 [Xenorhabdus bovienii SS-2004]
MLLKRKASEREIPLSELFLSSFRPFRRLQVQDEFLVTPLENGSQCAINRKQAHPPLFYASPQMSVKLITKILKISMLTLKRHRFLGLKSHLAQ